jgi:hypothetical protein
METADACIYVCTRIQVLLSPVSTDKRVYARRGEKPPWVGGADDVPVLDISPWGDLLSTALSVTLSVRETGCSAGALLATIK